MKLGRFRLIALRELRAGSSPSSIHSISTKDIYFDIFDAPKTDLLKWPVSGGMQ